MTPEQQAEASYMAWLNDNSNFAAPAPSLSVASQAGVHPNNFVDVRYADTPRVDYPVPTGPQPRTQYYGGNTYGPLGPLGTDPRTIGHVSAHNDPYHSTMSAVTVNGSVGPVVSYASRDPHVLWAPEVPNAYALLNQALAAGRRDPDPRMFDLLAGLMKQQPAPRQGGGTPAPAGTKTKQPAKEDKTPLKEGNAEMQQPVTGPSTTSAVSPAKPVVTGSGGGGGGGGVVSGPTTPEVLRDYVLNNNTTYEEVGSDPELLREVTEGSVGRQVRGSDVAQVAREAMEPFTYIPAAAAAKVALPAKLADATRGYFAGAIPRGAESAYKAFRTRGIPTAAPSRMSINPKGPTPPALPVVSGGTPVPPPLTGGGALALPVPAPRLTVPAPVPSRVQVPAPRAQRTVPQPKQAPAIDPANEAIIRNMARNWKQLGVIK